MSPVLIPCAECCKGTRRERLVKRAIDGRLICRTCAKMESK